MTTWTTGSAADEVLGPRMGSLEWRASLALKILAGINAAGIVLALIPAAVPESTFKVVAVSVFSGMLAILYVTVARALDRRRPWAVSAIRPLLLVLLAWGSYAFVTAFAAGTLRIPFAALAAIAALLGPADRRPLQRLSLGGGTVLAAAVALIALQLAGQPLFGWGGFFDVHEGDLNSTLTVECGAQGAAVPGRIAITYAWSWSSGTLFSNEVDEVVIGWNGDDAGGHPLYVLGDAPDAGVGINLAPSTGVSRAMGERAAQAWRGSSRWSIDLGARGIRQGRIELVLMRAAEHPPDPEPLVVGVSYIHLGVWQHDEATVTCSR